MKRKSNTIVYLVTGLDYGGAENQVIQLAGRMKSRGWDVKIVSMLPPQAFVDQLMAKGIDIATLDMTKGVADPRAVIRLGKLLLVWRPEILHSHNAPANLLGRITRLVSRVPVVVSTVHSVYEGPKWRELAYRITDPLCDMTTAVSQAVALRCRTNRTVSLKKLRVVPNGVDVSKFKPNSGIRTKLRDILGLQDRFVWLAVGRFHESKDYGTMLTAFSRLVARASNCILLIVGDGPLRISMHNLVNQLGLEQHVRFLGIRSDIPDLMNAADAYVMSSVWEGMPMVLLEAAASGLPIVATNVGGNAEVIQDGINGYLVPPKNPDALAKSMFRVMQLDDSARKSMGNHGIDYVTNNFSLDRIVQLWESLYGDLLHRLH